MQGGCWGCGRLFEWMFLLRCCFSAGRMHAVSPCNVALRFVECWLLPCQVENERISLDMVNSIVGGFRGTPTAAERKLLHCLMSILSLPILFLFLLYQYNLYIKRR